MQKNFWNFPLLEAEQAINGVLYPVNTYLKEYYPTGTVKVAVLPGEEAFVEINGNKYKPVEWDGSMEFHASEFPVRCYLAEDAELNGYLLKAGSWTTFYESGIPKAASLAVETEIAGIKLQPAQVVFYPDGKLQFGVIAEDITIAGLAFKVGEFIEFDAAGNAGKVEK